MVRWTRSGEWMTCLGAGLAYSYWDDQCGLDFDLEARARAAVRDGRTYQQQVLRLEWMGRTLLENQKQVRRENLPDPNSPWYTLGMMQRRHLAAQKRPVPVQVEECNANGPRNKIRELCSLAKGGGGRNGPAGTVKRDENGTLVVPAASCSNHSKSDKQVMFMTCFSGGQQLYVQDAGDLDYSIDVHETKKATYLLTLRVATAHRNDDTLTVTAGQDETSASTIQLPYSKGLWQETEPVRVELAGPVAKLHFARPNKDAKGFAFHSFKLQPVE
jgi:hypothetical protein